MSRYHLDLQITLSSRFRIFPDSQQNGQNNENTNNYLWMEMEERNSAFPTFQMLNVKKISNYLFFSFCRSSQSCKVTPLNDDDDDKVLKNWSEKFLTLELK